MNGWSALDRFLRTNPRDVGCARGNGNAAPLRGTGGRRRPGGRSVPGHRGAPARVGARRRRFLWPRRHRNRCPARWLPGLGGDTGRPTASAIQLAIGLLTAGLDSPDLEAWAVYTLIPEDPAAWGDLLAGQYVVAQFLLYELCESTGRSPEATLQRLAILAENGGRTH
jgi:hypothetical protein